MKGDSTATYTFRDGTDECPEAGSGDRIRAAHPAGRRLTPQKPADRARLRSAPRDPLDGDPALGYTETGCIGCTLEIAGAPDLRGGRRTSGSAGRIVARMSEEAGSTSARTDRVATTLAEPRWGSFCLPSWQRTGKFPWDPRQTTAQRLSRNENGARMRRSVKRCRAPGDPTTSTNALVSQCCFPRWLA